MTTEEFEQLQAEENEAYLQYKEVLDQAEVYREKWLPIYSRYACALEFKHKEMLRQAIEDNKSAHDLKEEREARMADYERDRAV